MPKATKNDSSASQKRYSFPKMPGTRASSPGTNQKRNLFRKFEFDNDGTEYNRGPFARDSVENVGASAQSIEQEAYSQGFKKGEKDGLESIHEQLEPILNNLKTVVYKIEEANQALLITAEEEAVRLSLAIAEKIIHHEVRIKKDVILETLKSTLKKIIDQKKIKIKLCPSDLAFISESKPGFLDFQDRFETVTFEEDPSVSKGGCIVETELGDVDARIEKQLEVVSEALSFEMRKVKYGGQPPPDGTGL